MLAGLAPLDLFTESTAISGPLRPLSPESEPCARDAMSAFLSAIQRRWREWRNRHADNERDLMQVIRDTWLVQ